MDAPSHLSTPPAPVFPHQRAQGVLRLAIKRRGAASVLASLRQEGCLKARFPRPAGWLEVVMLNTSGGVAGGDRLEACFTVQDGACATITSQAAERFYRALPADPPAHLRARIMLAPGAAVEWLPQESILFDRAALDRALDVSLAADAWFLGVETLMFGRVAKGERVATARLADRICIRREGRLILHESVRPGPDVAGVLARAASAAGRMAAATLVHVAPDAESRLEALRAAWAGAASTMGAEAGASAWDGLLLGRIVAPDAASLRRTLLAALPVLRGCPLTVDPGNLGSGGTRRDVAGFLR
jgi:urease accessory protein